MHDPPHHGLRSQVSPNPPNAGVWYDRHDALSARVNLKRGRQIQDACCLLREGRLWGFDQPTNFSTLPRSSTSTVMCPSDGQQ